MNTQTVDYAINKLNEAFQSIKPTAVELGNEYIEFVVFKEVVFATICTALLACGIFSVVIGLMQLKKDSGSNSGYGFTLVGLMVTVPTSALSVCAWYHAILAMNHPLMYAISRLAK